ncbi:hypothetical protein [Streptomyces kasugaensis]|nr:hypothetical protein [Streptomyces kasugaensis]
MVGAIFTAEAFFRRVVDERRAVDKRWVMDERWAVGPAPDGTEG